MTPRQAFRAMLRDWPIIVAGFVAAFLLLPAAWVVGP